MIPGQRSFDCLSFRHGDTVLVRKGLQLGFGDCLLHTTADDDLLIVVSYHPYAQENLDVLAITHSKGAPVVAISDSEVSPVFGKAAVSFRVKDAEVRGFRALTASICLAQSFVIGYAYEKRGFLGAG